MRMRTRPNPDIIWVGLALESLYSRFHAGKTVLQHQRKEFMKREVYQYNIVRSSAYYQSGGGRLIVPSRISQLTSTSLQ